MKRSTHILLLLSVLCFSIAVYLYNSKYSLASKEYLKEHFFKEIQTNLTKETEKLKKEIERAKEHLIAGDIKHFLSEQTIFYVSNEEILHWTDYHIPYKSIFSSGNEDWAIYKTTQGVFLIYKQDVKTHDNVNQLIGVVQMYRDYQLSSSFLRNGFNQDIFSDYNIKRKSVLDENGVFLKVDGVPLWKIEVEIDDSRTLSVLAVWILLLLIGFGLLLSYIRLVTLYFNGQDNYLVSLIIITIFILLTRFFMLWCKFPQNYFEFKLFDPQIFASSNNINASFGDLFLNIICAFIILIYAYKWLVRYKVYHQLLQMKVIQSAVTSFLLVFLSFLISLTVYAIFFNIYSNSQVNFDITESLHFDEPEFMYIIIFICLIGVFFLVNHFVLRAVYMLNRKSKETIFIHILIQVVIFTIIEYIQFGINVWLPLITGGYLVVCIVFLLFTDFRNLQYKAYLYLIFSALTCSLIISFTITRISNEKDFIRKSIFADHLILHNDIQGEYMMSEVGKYMRSDELILKNLKNGFVAKEKIEDVVREKYLSNYFDKYEIHFSYYNKNGQAYYKNELIGDLAQVESAYQEEKYKTWLGDLFFITNFKKDFFSKYYHFIEVKEDDEVIGVVVIDYTLKKYIARSILPGLLQLSAVEGYKNIDKYNYAIFSKGVLQYSVGEFNYNSNDFKPLLSDKVVHSKDVLNNGYHHIILSGADDKTIIVSSKDDKFFKILTNFSFHFLILILVTLLFLIVNAVIYFSKRKTNDFSTKIQTYLNAATFAPMIFLSVLILSLIATSYKKDQELKFKNSAEILSSHVLGYLDEFENGEIDKLGFKNSIDRLSKYSGTDINIYNDRGRLLISNQPLLYEAGVVSNLINPRAGREIFEMKHRMVELEERIGEFAYNTVYVALTKPETSEFLGVMSIPFFNSAYQMEQKKISALAIIINVFAVVFVLLLIGSFFVTKSLTAPLKLIANKLRKVETGNKNEPLIWDANDELGLLVNEYNLMLEKIEDSKKTLVQSEKEQAWKEMAKQVAHEIKNPLTPMKLKLQHLQRVLGSEDERIGKSIDSLLDQIETLNEIATSFSSFAKMPMPEITYFDLSEICLHTVSLYENNEAYDVISDIKTEIFINGDDNLIGRILTNLILNGIQSVAGDVRPLIHVGLHQKNNKVLLSIKDNGTGIPEDIQSKVFIPNFTTKYTGSGIGLAVAKNGIEQMGGQIWFETKQDIGTVFYIELNNA